ncbi:hypothetical protein HEP84_01280 [Streptomyces sp. RLB1-33]|nr:hypothetical protein [Streptomyces sp. RLB1-33]QIY68128.1 hypothetical protein HEP84_01280 [Streptomyces sp. RLB1-33]
MALLIAWQPAATCGSCNRSQLPPPADVLDAARSLLARGELGHHIAIGVRRVLIGFAVGASLGLLLGGLAGLSRTARAVVSGPDSGTHRTGCSSRPGCRPSSTRSPRWYCTSA